MSQRRFSGGTRWPGSEWRYGDGTRNIQGDYYFEGKYSQPANWSIQYLHDYHPEVFEIPPYPEYMLVGEGL